MPDFSQLQQLTDINFVDTAVNDMLTAAINTYQQAYFSLTGKQITVQPGDDVYIILYANALQNYSVLQSINAAARQNFLKYATGSNLDQLAANKGIIRSTAQPAVTSITFTLGAVLSVPVTIPQGTRVTPGNGIYFATDEAVSIPDGNTAVTVSATCTTTGSAGNGYIPGQINMVVDSVPYIQSVTNTETSAGGSDLESDLSLAEKVFSGNEGFSVAGPGGAYEYFARQYSSSIIDAKALTPSPGVVNLYVLLTGGTLPNQTFLDDLASYIGSDDRRPLTDNFTALAPDVQNYNINLTYYIDPANANQAATIQAAVTTAVSNFTTWTQKKIGRGIIPDQLTAGIIGAGAKRAVINSPVFTAIPATAIAIAQTITVTYGGLDNG